MPSGDVHDHIVVKAKRFQCSRCQRQFARLEHLQRHDRTHKSHGSLSYVCNEDTQERPFECPQCDSRFTRSDLLIRHERLSHNKDRRQQRPRRSSLDTPYSSTTRKRPKRSIETNVPNDDQGLPFHDAVIATVPLIEPPELPIPHFEPPLLPISPPPSAQHRQVEYYQSRSETCSPTDVQNSFQDALCASPTPGSFGPIGSSPKNLMNGRGSSTSILPFSDTGESGPAHIGTELDAPLNSFVDSFQTGMFSSIDTSLSFFSFDSFQNAEEVNNSSIQPTSIHLSQQQVELAESSSFSRFGSRLPSVQPEEYHLENGDSNPEVCYQGESQLPHRQPRKVLDVSTQDRIWMLGAVSDFTSIPPDFQLPTKLSLSRYIRAYIDGFHEHLPFLHIPTLSVQSCFVEVPLAMAAVGAQYCFEPEKGVELFHVAKTIAAERIRRRDARVVLSQRDHELDCPVLSTGSLDVSPDSLDRPGSAHSHVVNGPLGLPFNRDSSAMANSSKDELMQTAQALLILMAMATWSKHQEILREALAIQSILASVVREHGLQVRQLASRNWEEWAKFESILRTKFVVFCFFNLHCIVYDIPPLILSSELNMQLPCSAEEFKADSMERWQESRDRATKSSQFQNAIRSLYSSDGEDTPSSHSALGNYILIHAIVQQIFFVRQTARCRFNSSEFMIDEVAPLDKALHNWKRGWEQSHESSLNPADPNGPVAFNSTALLRLAYVRLRMDTGPVRALGTRDPLQIAQALHNAPSIPRTPGLIRALLHAAHALSIPINIGIRLVARTQTFVWSIQHSLCSLECALLLSKWLDGVMMQGSGHDGYGSITKEERTILFLVKTMLDETEFSVPSDKTFDLAEMAKCLNVGVVRAWATIFRGAQTWAIVDVIGSALSIYADMLETA